MVRISISEGALLRASAILYLIPAVFLIAGASIGYFLSRGGDSDPAVALGAGAGLLSGFCVTWLAGRVAAKKQSGTPTLVEIVSRAKD